jgi:cell division protein FtsZ
MSISLSLPKSVELKPRIVVIGVGGAGGNAVNNMITSGLDGVEFVVANTDAQALALSKADRRIQMGSAITQGLGAGMRPHVGEESAENSIAEIMEQLDGAHMLFVAAGMGGGTGTGAAPVIAKAARERGILTVAIVTKPFQFEGSKRMKLADAGIDNLYSCVDTLIVIPNQNLFRVATENTTMADAFAMADEVLNSGVRGVTDLMVVPGLINLDFADVRTVMDEMGKAMMGTGEATGERRAIEAAESAISNPLLDDVSLKGAKGVLINITGGNDLTLYEVDEAASLIRGQVDPDANIIVGSALDSDLDGIVRVSVVATGVSGDENFVTPRHDRGYAAEAEEPIFDDQEEMSEFEEEFEIEAEFEPEVAPIAAQAAAAPIAAPKPATSTYAYRQPETHQAPEPAPTQEMPPVQSQTVVKRPFGFFGRKKSVPVAPRTESRPAPTQTGDLFGSDAEDELEIPSFLRRQN